MSKTRQDERRRKEEEVVAERLAFLQRMHAEQREFQEKKKLGLGLLGPGQQEDDADG